MSEASDERFIDIVGTAQVTTALVAQALLLNNREYGQVTVYQADGSHAVGVFVVGESAERALIALKSVLEGVVTLQEERDMRALGKAVKA